MTRGRKVAYLIMFCLVARHLLFDSYGPLDRLLEIGVFVLIAYEVTVGILTRRKEHKRRLFLAGILADLSNFMEKGQKVQQAIPRPISDPTTDATWKNITDWMDSVRTWNEETSTFLVHHSPRAYAAFSLVVGAKHADSVVYMQSGDSFPITGQFRECYQKLLVQLDNLRQIMGKPEAYF